MLINKRDGLTLNEGLIGTALVSIMLICVLGAVLISKFTAPHARHKMIAMNIVRDYMEREIASGYNNGNYSTIASDAPFTQSSDGVTFTITPYPITSGTVKAPITSIGSQKYKTIGFKASWNERSLGGGVIASSERVMTYVADHP